MIDISTEAVVTLTEATHHLPRRRKGKRCAVSTLYRWADRGVRGVRLETIQVGGTKCTSWEALQRFFNRLSSADSPHVQDQAVQSVSPHQMRDDLQIMLHPTPSGRRRAAEAAERALMREGL